MLNAYLCGSDGLACGVHLYPAHCADSGVEARESGHEVGGDVPHERNVGTGHDGVDGGRSHDHLPVIGASVHVSGVCEHPLICRTDLSLLFGFCPHCWRRREEEAMEVGVEEEEEGGVVLFEKSWLYWCEQAFLLVGQWRRAMEQLSWQPAACQHHHPPPPLSLGGGAEQRGEEGSWVASVRVLGTQEGGVYGDGGQYLQHQVLGEWARHEAPRRVQQQDSLH